MLVLSYLPWTTALKKTDSQDDLNHRAWKMKCYLNSSGKAYTRLRYLFSLQLCLQYPAQVFEKYLLQINNFEAECKIVDMIQRTLRWFKNYWIRLRKGIGKELEDSSSVRMRLYIIQVKNDINICPGNMDKKEGGFIYINVERFKTVWNMGHKNLWRLLFTVKMLR